MSRGNVYTITYKLIIYSMTDKSLLNKPRNKSVTIKISEDYLQQEHTHGNYIRNWILDYCKSNKIIVSTLGEPDMLQYHKTNYYLQLTFNSVNQMNWFQRKGNQSYPYFEFL